MNSKSSKFYEQKLSLFEGSGRWQLLCAIKIRSFLRQIIWYLCDRLSVCSLSVTDFNTNAVLPMPMPMPLLLPVANLLVTEVELVCQKLNPITQV